MSMPVRFLAAGLILMSLACRSGATRATAIPTPAPTLAVKAWVDFEVSYPGDTETIHVKVFDLQGRALKGVTVVGVRELPGGGVESLTFPVTDEQGHSEWSETAPAVEELSTFFVRVYATRDADHGEASTSYSVRP